MPSARPASRYCRREIPPGLRQEFIAPTFLGSLGWISLLSPFLPAPRPAFLSGAVRVAPYFAVEIPPERTRLPNRHDDHRSRYLGKTATARSRRRFYVRPGAFPRTSRRRFGRLTTNRGHLSQEETRSYSLFSLFRSHFAKWISIERSS